MVFPTTSTTTAVARGGTIDDQPVAVSALFQPRRLDVMVHLRALVEVSGYAWPVTGPTDRNWLERSDTLAAGDGEPSVVSMGVDADLDAPSLPAVSFAAGGGLSRGATAAAAAIHAGTVLQRDPDPGLAARRGHDDLQRLGYTDEQIRSLVLVWLHHDLHSSLVLVKLGDDAAAAALHELRCRYEEFHTELDHVDAVEAAELGLDAHGSVQLVSLAGRSDGFADVVARHPAIIGALSGVDAVRAASTLFAPDRRRSTSADHQQRVRRMRRRAAAGQLVDRIRR